MVIHSIKPHQHQRQSVTWAPETVDIKKRINHAYSFACKGLDSHENKDFNSAVDFFTQSIALLNQDKNPSAQMIKLLAAVHVLRGNTFLLRNDLQSALLDYRSGENLDPSSIKYLRRD